MASCPLEAMSQEYPSELTTFERMSRMIGSSSTIRIFSAFGLSTDVETSGTGIGELEPISLVVSSIRVDLPLSVLLRLT